MNFRGGEFSTGEMGNFHQALTIGMLGHSICIVQSDTQLC